MSRVKITAKHASNSLVTFASICHTQAFCRPLLYVVLLRKLTNMVGLPLNSLRPPPHNMEASSVSSLFWLTGCPT